MKRWTLDDIPWDKFDSTKIAAEIVLVVKTASLVEYNSADYAAYLRNVFSDDPAFQDAADAWASEERQHGQALGQWAQKADPGFDFEASFQHFVSGYRIPSRIGNIRKGIPIRRADRSLCRRVRNKLDVHGAPRRHR